MLNRLRRMLRPTAQEGVDDSGVLVNAYCTRTVIPEVGFPHRFQQRRGISDPALSEHLRGFVGYVVSRNPQQMTHTTYHVIDHIRRVRNQVSLLVPEAQMDELASWAEAANALIFLPDGSVRDPHGRTLVSAAGGDPDPGAAVPHPAEAWQRKARSEALLEARGLHAPAFLPPLVSESEVSLRTPMEVVERALALLLVAVRAESLASGAPMSAAELRAKLGGWPFRLSPKEEVFVAEEEPSREDVVQFSWRYEGVFLLQWALGLAPDLPFPERICDVPKTTQTLLEYGSTLPLRRPELLDPALILDALDFHYRLHWHVRQARLDGKEPPPGVDGGVVQERHHALNWLVRFGDAEWDDVDTPT